MASKIYSGDNKRKRPTKCVHTIGQTTIDLLHPPPPKTLMNTIKSNNKTMIVPMRVPREQPKALQKSEFERLMNQATVVTQEEKQAKIEAAEKLKKQKEIESTIRKEELKKAQLKQQLQAGRKLTLMETEAQKKNQYLLKRAFDLRQEQEDEVKHANQLILASKCLAIRAAQVREKELIKQELDEEEMRLCEMMEQQRRISLQKEEDAKKREMIKKQEFVASQMQQIHEKEIEKLMEGERKEEEARLQNLAMIQMQKDTEAKRQAKALQQEKMRQDLNLANEEILKFKQIEKEENRIADLRVQEFMRKKAEREAALEEEYRLAQIAKEKETARLRALQEKQADLQAARDEMNALRVQEEVEKQWRAKEKAAAEKRKLDDENLKAERAKQIDNIRRQQALALEREKQEFFRIVEVQKAEFIKEQRLIEKKRQDNLIHKRDILIQVNDKERDRINKQKEKFEEGLAIRAEQEMRTRYIRMALVSKMEKLRARKVPESVVKDIERQINAHYNMQL